MRGSSCLSRLVLSSNFLLGNRIRQIYLDFVDRNLTRDDWGRDITSSNAPKCGESLGTKPNNNGNIEIYPL